MEWSTLLTPLIVALVPILTALLKRFLPAGAKLSVLSVAVTLGPVLEYLSTYLSQQAAAPGRGVVLALVGIAVREVVDQLRKIQTGPTVARALLPLAVLAAALPGCATTTPLVCFDRGHAGYALGEATSIIEGRCAAKKLTEAQCARLAEIGEIAKRAVLMPPEDSSSVDYEAVMRFLLGAAKFAL